MCAHQIVPGNTGTGNCYYTVGTGICALAHTYQLISKEGVIGFLKSGG